MEATRRVEERLAVVDPSASDLQVAEVLPHGGDREDQADREEHVEKEHHESKPGRSAKLSSAVRMKSVLGPSWSLRSARRGTT
jgi:hypothetical protein